MRPENGPKVVKRRIHSVDLLRGIVIMIMLLDHVRDFVHAGALQNDPTDPATTTVAVFFTRWVTHFCAPAFVFLSGVSIYLQKRSGKPTDELSRFLWTRGLWLIFLEFTVIRFLLVFNIDYSFFGIAQVIWVIGVSMVVMAAMVHLPVKAVGTVGVLMIALHNLFDGIRIPPQVAFAGTPPPDIFQAVWIILHQPGVIPLFGGSAQIFSAYPLIPWIGVMMAGYALGTIYDLGAPERRRLLLYGGAAATVLFALLRSLNVYGDPSRWSVQATPVATFLSFLNTTKYPPSLLFLLMTLGPSLIVLALADAIEGRSLWQRICINFGRVPMFFFILQWVVAHGGGVLLGYLAGVDVGYLFLDLFQMGRTAPPGHGFSLLTVYLVWAAGLIMLYPVCAWYAGVKMRNKHWLLSYV